MSGCYIHFPMMSLGCKKLGPTYQLNRTANRREYETVAASPGAMRASVVRTMLRLIRVAIVVHVVYKPKPFWTCEYIGKDYDLSLLERKCKHNSTSVPIHVCWQTYTDTKTSVVLTKMRTSQRSTL